MAFVALVATCATPLVAGAATPALERIYVGQQLSVGQSLTSSSGVYTAHLTHGSLISVTKDGHVVWSSQVAFGDNKAFMVLANGNVEIRAVQARSKRASFARRQTTSYMTVLGNGDLALVTKSGVVKWQMGPAAHLSTSTPLYTPGELYGASNPSAACYTCEASTVTGSAPPSNTLDAGTQVDALTGDFTTANDLFEAPAIGGSLGLSLSYDAQLAQSELIGGTNPAPFGYGWTSNLSASISASQSSSPNSTETVTQGNGSEVTFSQSANGGTSSACETAGSSTASGDYPSTAKYTVVGSSTQWCALASVQGQLGVIGSTGLTYETNGGQDIEDFAWNGQLAEETTNADSASMPVEGISFLYGVTGGSLATTASGVALGEQCPSNDTCDIAYASDGRSVVEVLNGSGLVTSIISPAGTTYTLNYDGDENLLSVAAPQTATLTSTWNYVYSESLGTPYSSDLEEIYDPDAVISSPASLSPGLLHSTTVNYGTQSSSTPGMVSSVEDGYAVPSITAYSYTNECAPTSSQPTDQCLNQGAQQVTTITYPAQSPCPGANCTPQSPIEIDQYSAGIETSSQLGAASSSVDNEAWLFNWNFGNGTANSSEVVTYPSTLHTNTVVGAQAPSATILTDPSGNIVSTTNALGDVATSAYNDVGPNNLPELLWSFPGPVSSTATVAPPGSWTYTYNPYGQVVTETDPLGHVTTYGYYQGDSLLCFVAPPLVSASMNAVPTCTSSAALADQGAIGVPVGSTTYGYDAQGDTVATTLDSGDTAVGADPQSTTTAYDVLGNQLWSIPATGQALGQSSLNPFATSTTYSLASQPLVVTAPDANVTTYSYDPAANVTSVSTPAATTTTIYDGDNRACYSVTTSAPLTGLSCSSGAQAGSTSTSYVPGGTTVASRTDANGHTTSYYYADLAYPSSPTEVVDPLGTAITYSAYDDLGNRCLTGDVATTLPSAGQCSWVAGDTATSYNALGSPLVITNPNGPGDDVLTNTYANAAYPTNVTSTTNGLGNVTRYSYDADGRLITTLNPNQTTETTVYNVNGQVCLRAPSALSYPCGEGPAAPGVSQYTYNLAGDLTSMSDNVGDVAGTGTWSQTSSFSYANGQLTSTTDANNKTVSYLYNDAGQVACEAYPVSTNATCGTLSAPAVGSATNTVVHRSYDPAGRLVSSSDWLGNTVTYAYGDANDPSAPTSVTYPSSTNLQTIYGYDPAGNLTCLSTATPATTTSTSTSGAPSCVTPTTSPSPLLSDAWTYNADEQVLTSSVAAATSGAVTYNANRQITAASTLGSSTSNDTFALANNAEITSDQSSTGSTLNFSYNQGDELTCASATTGAPCAGATSNATQYGYDANGDRTSSTTTSPATGTGTGTTSVTTNYSWNALGELCGVGPANLSCGALPASGTSYDYDGLGLRTQTLTPTSATDTTWDTVSGGSLPLDVNDATTTSVTSTNTSYLYGDLLFGGSAPLEQITTTSAGATPVFVISSPTGVQGVVSATGTLLESATYSPYGTQHLAPGTSSVTPFGFQGSYSDPTGLAYLINRYYDPATDSFLSVDPDVQQTDQPYTFVDDDPLNASDPLGLYDCSNKSQSYIVAKYKRGDQSINLVCGVANQPGQTGYGVIHIQEDGKHFGGDLSDLALREIQVTISRGKLVDSRGATVAYVQKFQVEGNSDDLPEPETFTVRVVVDNQFGRVTTARIEEPIVDQNRFDGCHFAGINLC